MDNGYLKEAKRIFKLAKKEYVRAKEKRNEMKARQAADKGYLCLLKTVNAFFINCGIDSDKLPKGERGRLHFLGKYGDKEISGKYSKIRHDFYIDAFHEGIINYKILDYRFEDLDELVKQVAGEG